jgi:hypothetical protein
MSNTQEQLEFAENKFTSVNGFIPVKITEAKTKSAIIVPKENSAGKHAIVTKTTVVLFDGATIPTTLSVNDTIVLAPDIRIMKTHINEIETYFVHKSSVVAVVPFTV